MQLITYICIFGLLIVGFCAIYLIKLQKEASTKLEMDIALQETQIANMKQTVVEKQDEISRIEQEYQNADKDLKSSIHYAERIQRAIIPQEIEFKTLFPDCFIYFSPRDIVSGDFYTCASLHDCKIAIVADCTGHGVPGGLLSMLGMSALKDLLSKPTSFNELKPGEILDELRKFVLTSLAEADETDDSTINDGMDITIGVFNNNMTQIRYATANHTIYVARNGEIIKLKGCRMPIGRHPKQDEPFDSFSFDLLPNDMVYMCSDGIQDQFGSEENIKFSTKRLVALLHDNCNKDIQTQYAQISKCVDDWKNGREQFDDQTLIGIKI